jgi:polar amino acid transport system substrate-binding protein
VYLELMRVLAAYSVFAAVVVLVACLAVPSAYGAAQPAVEGERPLVLATGLRPDTRLMRAAQYLYSSLFARVGRRVELRFIPSVRARYEANQGHVDGDFFRIADYGQRAPNLVRVDEPVAQEGFGIYVASNRFMGLKTLADIMAWSGEPLEIGYTKGIVGIDGLPGLAGLSKRHRLQSTPDLEIGARMLIKGHLDLYLGPLLVVEALLVQQGLDHSDIRCAGIFNRRDGYIFLHKRHAALVPGLEAAIRAMKAEGTYPDILDVVHGVWPDDAVLDAAVPPSVSEPLGVRGQKGGRE